MAYTSGTLNSAAAFNAIFDSYLLADGWTKTANSVVVSGAVNYSVNSVNTITVAANALANIPIGAKLTFTGSGAANVYLVAKPNTTAGSAFTDVAYTGLTGNITYSWNTYLKDGVYFVFAGLVATLSQQKHIIIFDMSTATSGASVKGTNAATREHPNCSFFPSASEIPCTYEIFKSTSPNEISVVFTFGNNQTEHFHLGVLQKIHASAYPGGQYIAACGGRLINTTARNFSASGNPETNLVIGSTGSSGPYGLFTEISGGAGSTSMNSLIICEIADTFVKETGNASASSTISLSQNCLKKFNRGLNQWNSQTTLVPIELQYNAPSSFKMFIGYPLHLRFCRIDNYNNGDIITLGSDQWKVYSVGKKDLAARTTSTAGNGTYGFAVRYVP
jgi:hypothetical protein